MRTSFLFALASALLFAAAPAAPGLLGEAQQARAQTPPPRPPTNPKPRTEGGVDARGGVAKPARPEAANYVGIIAHPSVPLDAISKSTLADLFSRDVRRWADGTPVVVMDYAGDAREREAFYDFLGRSSSRTKTLWLRQRLAGEGDPPLVFRDGPTLVAKVAATPGALSFVGAIHADDSVKTLRLILIEPD